MKTFEQELENIEQTLEELYDDPFFGLTLITEDYAIFNYPNYWDSRAEFSERIEEERQFLIDSAINLRGKYNKTIFIADDAVKL
jgi:hypothetical protein